MTYLADAHRDWHAVHGLNAVCPLDCGAGEAVMEDWEHEADSIEAGAPSFRCGHCKGRHTSVAMARRCADW